MTKWIFFIRTIFFSFNCVNLGYSIGVGVQARFLQVRGLIIKFWGLSDLISHSNFSVQFHK